LCSVGHWRSPPSRSGSSGSPGSFVDVA
jgi:hypothetical protein